MKRIISSLVFTALTLSVFTQAPHKMSYQAVIRNSSEQLVTNHSVGMKVSILQGSATGTPVYVETQVPTTNANGLAAIEIGSGVIVSGTFTGINWAAGPYFLKTETDPAGGTSYTIVGTSQLLSVPYAFNTKIAEGVADNSINSAKITDGAIASADLGSNSVTSAKITDGTIAAEDISANAITTEKINSGAVTGSKIAQAGATFGQVLKWNGTVWTPEADATGGGLTLPYSGTVSSNLFAFKVTNTLAAAINGIATLTEDFGIGVQGEALGRYGFGVAGLGAGAGVYGTSASATGRGIFGSASGTTGINYGVYGSSSSVSGYGVYGTAIATGNKASGVYGVGSNGSGVSGKVLFDGYGVYGLGESSFATNRGVLGQSNSQYGGIGVEGRAEALEGETIGVNGYARSPSGSGVRGYADAVTGANYGVHGQSRSPGGFGVFGQAPKYGIYGMATGSVGRAVVGEATGTSSIGVYGIATNTSSTGVWGEGVNQGIYGTSPSETGKGVFGQISSPNGFSGYFDGGKFYVNGNVGLKTTAPTQVLDVNGNARFRSIASDAYYGVLNRKSDGTLTTATSDIHFKDNVQALRGSLEKIKQLVGVSFTWKSNPEYGRRIGFIAQEFEKVFPELVFTNEVDGYKGINYSEVSAVLVEAIKEQQHIIEEQQKQINELKQLFSELAKRLDGVR